VSTQLTYCETVSHLDVAVKLNHCQGNTSPRSAMPRHNDGAGTLLGPSPLCINAVVSDAADAIVKVHVVVGGAVVVVAACLPRTISLTDRLQKALNQVTHRTQIPLAKNLKQSSFFP